MKPNKQISSIESRLTTESLPAVAIQQQEAAHSYILELVKMLLLLASSLGLFSILLRMMNETISTETGESSALSIVSETDLSQFTWLIPITLGAVLSQNSNAMTRLASIAAASLFALPPANAGWFPDFLGIDDSIENAANLLRGLVAQVGEELKLRIAETDKVLTARIEQVGNETNKVVANFGKEGRLTAEKIGEEVRITADQALTKFIDGAELILKVTGQEVRATVQEIGLQGGLFVREVGIQARLTLKEGEQALIGVIKALDDASNKFVINLGKEGQLLIEKIGDEVRISTDEILATFFKESKATLQIAGQETRLTLEKTEEVVDKMTGKIHLRLNAVIGYASEEIHSILDDLPDLSRLVGESFIRGVMTELKDKTIGLTAIEKVLKDMDNYVSNRKLSPNLKSLLEHVSIQNQLSPQDKAKLYIRLIEHVNKPEISTRQKSILMCIIGKTAIDDKHLSPSETSFFGRSSNPHYADAVIDIIPLQDVRSILKKSTDSTLRNYLGITDAKPLMDYLEKPSVSKLDYDGSIPLGTVIAFSSEVEFEDFIECDGRELNVEEYPALYNILKDRYGSRWDSVNDKRYFNIPDYRGHFLRGSVSGNKSIGEKQQDTTALPKDAFIISTAGEHEHKLSTAGEHTHAMMDAGVHDHLIHKAGAHKHDVDGVKDHSHVMQSSGAHTHEVKENGEHRHGMADAGGHFHYSIHNYHGKHAIQEMQRRGLYNQPPEMSSSQNIDSFYEQIARNTTATQDHAHVIHASGKHSHTLNTVNAHTHELRDNGAHTHTMKVEGEHKHHIDSAGSHQHIIKSAEGHLHTVEASGEHTHVIGGGDPETQPKNVQVKFMIKVKSSPSNTKKLQITVDSLEQELKDIKEELKQERSQNQASFFASTAAITLSVATVVSTACSRYFNRS